MDLTLNGISIYNAPAIEQSGIPGMKWHRRRYQNEDGSLTEAGKERYNKGGLSTKQKLAIGAGIIGSAAVGYAAYKNPKFRALMVNASKATGTNLKIAGEKASPKLKVAGEKLAKKTEKALDKSADAALNALFLSVGTLAISKMNAKLDSRQANTERQKNVNKIQKDVLNASMNTMVSSMSGTQVGSSNNNNNNKNNNKNNGGSTNNNNSNGGQKYSDKVGSPSKKGVNKQSPEWQALFKDANGNPRDEQTRADIKNMAGAGYDIDQIKNYLNHSDLICNKLYLGIIYPNLRVL